MPVPSPLPPLLLNVPAIAGRSPAEVEHVLGPPFRQSRVDVSQHVKRTYQGGSVEIVFVEDQANWIKLYNTRNLPFTKHALGRLGLPVSNPTYVNRDSVMSWHTIPRIRELSLYAGAGGDTSWVLVCVDLHYASRPRRNSKPLRLLGWKRSSGAG